MYLLRITKETNSLIEYGMHYETHRNRQSIASFNQPNVQFASQNRRARFRHVLLFSPFNRLQRRRFILYICWFICSYAPSLMFCRSVNSNRRKYPARTSIEWQREGFRSIRDDSISVRSIFASNPRVYFFTK